MACVGKLELETDVKSSADKFWNNMRESTIIFPKAFPHDYKSIEVLEGDGKAVGSVRLITYAEGSELAKESKEKIEAVDEEKKTVSYSVIEGDLLKYYKSFKGHISVSPKGEGSSVKWSCEYEKASEEIPDPHIIKDFVVKNFRELDDYTLQA
ncbi:MLP-like protein 423 [Momordica charantia]|uniref:MLP-like protein 423 n=1 Tax=Momordica charantia TaxID=3673 RepID=A0A6J1DCY3_MOMCH|nr:MLP-like protein 423 [Momordica charantia]